MAARRRSRGSRSSRKSRPGRARHANYFFTSDALAKGRLRESELIDMLDTLRGGKDGEEYRGKPKKLVDYANYVLRGNRARGESHVVVKYDKARDRFIVREED